MTGPEALICQEASHGYTIIRRRRSFPRRGRSLGFGYHDHAGANPWRNALASYFGDALSSPPLPPPHMTCGGKLQQQARHFEKTEEVHSQILQFPLLETSHRKRQAFANFPRGALLRKHRKCAWVVFSYARHPFGIVFPSFVFLFSDRRCLRRSWASCDFCRMKHVSFLILTNKHVPDSPSLESVKFCCQEFPIYFVFSSVIAWNSFSQGVRTLLIRMNKQLRILLV